MDSLHHLLLLCCYGGQPFIDFHSSVKHQGTHQLDPTEWIAEDTKGDQLENSTLHDSPFLDRLLLAGTDLRSCDLFNVTFLTTADQNYYERLKAELSCRCPPGTSGLSCEVLNRVPTALPLIQVTEESSNIIPMVIVFAAVLLALFCIVFMMVRGCFCDCFGPWTGLCKKPRQEDYDKPLDPRDVEKCLRKYRQMEMEQDMRNSSSVPLVSTIYNPTVVPTAPPPPMANPPRPSSPPPPYSSLDHLPTRSTNL